jgi:protein SCO1/2
MRPLLRRAPLLAAAILAAACGRAPAPASTGDATARAESSVVSDFSVYELESSWRDQKGEERALASLGGRIQVVAMVYTHCAHTCPRIIGELKAMEAALSAADRDDVGFVLVSIDPQRDTPARLAEFATSTRLDPTRWTLLTGGDEGVRELAALLGIRYRPEGETEYSHANTYLVLDEEGRIIYRHDGLEGGIGEPLARIRAAVE